MAETNVLITTNAVTAPAATGFAGGFESYLERLGEWVITSGPRILLIIVVILILVKLVHLASERLGNLLRNRKPDPEYEKRARTLTSIIHWTLRMTVFAVGAMMLLKQFNIDIGPVIAAAGVVGLAIGFGAQNLVQDVITGFFLLLEDQLRVGDVVQIGDKGGLVERVTLRMVVLRDGAGTVHYIRNAKIEVVSNMTQNFSRYVFSIGVSYQENLERVIEVLKQLDAELRADPAYKDDIIEPMEVQGVDSFGESAIVIKAHITTRPIKQWRVGREYNLRLKKRFDELGIEMPYPTRTLYMGREKSGAAAPLRVETAVAGDKPAPAA